MRFQVSIDVKINEHTTAMTKNSQASEQRDEEEDCKDGRTVKWAVFSSLAFLIVAIIVLLTTFLGCGRKQKSTKSLPSVEKSVKYSKDSKATNRFEQRPRQLYGERNPRCAVKRVPLRRGFDDEVTVSEEIYQTDEMSINHCGIQDNTDMRMHRIKPNATFGKASENTDEQEPTALLPPSSSKDSTENQPHQ